MVEGRLLLLQLRAALAKSLTMIPLKTSLPLMAEGLAVALEVILVEEEAAVALETQALTATQVAPAVVVETLPLKAPLRGIVWVDVVQRAETQEIMTDLTPNTVAVAAAEDVMEPVHKRGVLCTVEGEVLVVPL